MKHIFADPHHPLLYLALSNLINSEGSYFINSDLIIAFVGHFSSLISDGLSNSEFKIKLGVT